MKKIQWVFSGILSLSFVPFFLNASQSPISYDDKYMTGDWGGIRSKLKNEGYDFTLEYGSMVTSNISGGYAKNRTIRYSDQYIVGIDLDLEKIWNINDGEFKASVIDRNGRDLTSDRIQDPRAPVIGSSVNSNYGRGQTWHAAQLWYRQSWFEKTVDLKVGLMPVGEDFDNNGCFFQNLALCGSLAGHGSGVWYNTPVGQWGSRLRFNLTPQFYMQTAAFLYNPNYATRSGSFRLDNTGKKGNMYLLELGYITSLGPQQLPGSIRLGGWYNTADTNDVLEDSDGGAYVLSRKSPRVHNGRYGTWIYVQQQVIAGKGAPGSGLSFFWHLAMNDRDTATMDYQTQAGLIYKGLFAARPMDYIGLGISKIHVNSNVAKRARLMNERQRITDYNDPDWSPIRTAEYAAELHYSFAITPWFTFRPNVQVLVHPGGVKEVQDAWVLGSQFIVKM